METLAPCVSPLQVSLPWEHSTMLPSIVFAWLALGGVTMCSQLPQDRTESPDRNGMQRKKLALSLTDPCFNFKWM